MAETMAVLGSGLFVDEPLLFKSQTPNFAAALSDLGPGAGDGQTQDLHGGYKRESLLL